ncbi:hypothetical protein I305_06479 [Cryptococcus gattii E566]|nr:hypothetical protein I305_06479 [Cryptococcus gattii E566]
MYARLNAPPEHRHLWTEDPEGLLQLLWAISSKRLSAARSVGLPSYLFPWDLFLDSENAEEAIKSF